MGMLDSMFNEGGYEPGIKDAAKAFIPLIGPLLAISGVRKKDRKAREQWAQENSMFSDPGELSDMGKRVQERMMERVPGETTKPGFMAGHMLQQEAGDSANMNNLGNIFAAASSRLAGAGEVAAADTLGSYAHKTKQAPWKPEEGQMKPMNFTKNGQVKSTYDVGEAKALVADGWKYTGVADQDKKWQIKQGSELGMQGAAATDYYKVRMGDDGTPVDYQKLDNAPKVSVGGTNLVTPADMSQAVVNFVGSTKAAKDLANTTRRLRELVARNPTGGVQGWSGVVTGVVGKVLNLTDFVKGLGSDEAKIVDQYSPEIMKHATKYFPTADEAQAQSLTIQLAYSIARVNNMGTAGGGRGITDADMQYALKQLGAMSQPSDMLKVIDYQEQRALDNYDMDYEGTRAIFEANQAQFPANLDNLYKATRGERKQAGPRKFDIEPGGRLPADLKIGDVVNGKRWNGGMVNKPESWETP